MNRSEEAIERHWPEFTEDVRRRLKIGAVEYGDRSLDRSPAELIGEIEQELADVMGWGFILYTRLQKIKALVERSAAQGAK